MAAAIDDVCVRLAAAALQDKCSSNKALDNLNHVTKFHSARIPSITMPDYFKRIAKYSHCSAECHIIALIYIDRHVKTREIPITFRNIHRLVIVAVMVAAKLRDDIYYSNAYYASIGGVSNREINELEVELLLSLNWDTYVSFEEYDQYFENLLQKYGDLVGCAPNSLK
jgi:hypothetical protein